MENATAAVFGSVWKNIEQVAHAASRVTATASTVSTLSTGSKPVHKVSLAQEVSPAPSIEKIDPTAPSDWRVLSLEVKAAVLKELAPKIQILAGERTQARKEQQALEQAQMQIVTRLKNAECAHRWYDAALAFVSSASLARHVDLKTSRLEQAKIALRIQELRACGAQKSGEISALFADFCIVNDPYSARVIIEREKGEALIQEAKRCADVALQAVESVGTFVSQEALGKTLKLLNETLTQAISFVRTVALTESELSSSSHRINPRFELPSPLIQALGDLAYAQRQGWRSAASISQSVLAALSKVDVYFRDLVQEELRRGLDNLVVVDSMRRELIRSAVRGSI